MARSTTLIAVQESWSRFPVLLSSGGSSAVGSGVIGLLPAGILRIALGLPSGRWFSLSDMVLVREVVITKWRQRMEKEHQRRIQASAEIATSPLPDLAQR